MAARVNMGSAYHQLGDLRRSIQYSEQELEIARKTGQQRQELDLLLATLVASGLCLPLRRRDHSRIICEHRRPMIACTPHEVNSMATRFQVALQPTIQEAIETFEIPGFAIRAAQRSASRTFVCGHRRGRHPTHR
jgi:hypothetical protein